jgi:hypothetical protein
MHKAIGPETVKALQQYPRMASGYILDNPFICGSDSKVKLSDDTSSRVVSLLAMELAAGTAGWTSMKFKQDLCKPAKKAEMWCRQMVTKFGGLASESAFYARVRENLFTIGGLQRVLATMEGENVPLHGSSDANCGIEECRKLVMELVKLKHPAPEEVKPEPVVTMDNLEEADQNDGMVASGVPVLGLSPLESKAQCSAESEMDHVTTLDLFNSVSFIFFALLFASSDWAIYLT